MYCALLAEQDFSVWPIRSVRFGLSRYGLVDSVWPFRSRDNSVRQWNFAEILH